MESQEEWGVRLNIDSSLKEFSCEAEQRNEAVAEVIPLSMVQICLI